MLFVPISDQFGCGKLDSGRGILSKLINVTNFLNQVFTNISREEQEDGRVFRQGTIENLGHLRGGRGGLAMSHFLQRGGGGRADPAGRENLPERDLPQGETFLIKVKVKYKS